MKNKYFELEVKVVLFTEDAIFLTASFEGGTSSGFNDGHEEDFID